LQVISGKLLHDFAKMQASSAKPLRVWYVTARAADWGKLLDVQQQYASAEAVDGYTVFNVKGNEYRLVTRIDYQRRVIRISWLGTHAEYDKERWKR
jgi:mRNA interferase HigB